MAIIEKEDIFMEKNWLLERIEGVEKQDIVYKKS